MTPPEIRLAKVLLDRVVKAYKKGIPPVVRGVTLEIGHGEFFILLGPSGCGKSTLLRMIAGLEEVSEGRVYIDDAIVNDVPPKDRNIAMVFQSYALYPHMTVRENMSFGLKMMGLPKAAIEQRVSKAAESLGLGALMERQPRELSGGQRQRVALGRAIVREPAVFLLDEPLSNLDAKLRGGMRAELKRLHDRLGATMIYVTHDQVEAMTLGDRVAVIDKGIIQQVGTPLDVYDRPQNRFVAGFLGNPPMNFLPGEVRAGALRRGDAPPLPLGERLSQAVPDGTPVELGVRPEDFSVVPIEDGAVAPLAGRAAVVEPLGDQVVLTVDLEGEGGSLVAKTSPTKTPRAGQRVRLEPDPERSHLFARDEEGKNLSLKAVGAPA
ncbi:MAG TPA: ABC transporter ATP-binding protein [Planctomycetota bacterium]|nr:ABC transporter ATP-binding protein [Planctomycetota bacterium]